MGTPKMIRLFLVRNVLLGSVWCLSMTQIRKKTFGIPQQPRLAGVGAKEAPPVKEAACFSFGSWVEDGPAWDGNSKEVL